MPTINELSKAAYENSKAHGFWDGPRNKGEMIALMHEELSECLGYIRKPNADGSPKMSDHIPEFTGEAEEMADVCVRIFDYLGGFGLTLKDGETPLAVILESRKGIYTEEEVNKGERIAEMHHLLSAAYSSGQVSERGSSIWLRHAALEIFAYCAHFGIDLEAAITAKMQYNASRPFMHGKKF